MVVGLTDLDAWMVTVRMSLEERCAKGLDACLSDGSHFAWLTPDLAISVDARFTIRPLAKNGLYGAWPTTITTVRWCSMVCVESSGALLTLGATCWGNFATPEAVGSVIRKISEMPRNTQ